MPIDPATQSQYITNAGDVRSRGAELETTFLVARGFSLGANAAFNDVKYLKYNNAPCPPEITATSCNLSGRAALVNAPRWTSSLNAQYAHAVAEGVEGYFNANTAYRTETFGTLDASKYAKIPAYALTNLSAGARFGWRRQVGRVAVGQERVRQAVLHQPVEYQLRRL
jgi:iron complex outermembrane receptor protein